MMCNAIYQYGNDKIGFCTVLVQHPPHTDYPAKVEETRRQINDALSLMSTNIQGRPMKVTVDFRDDLYTNGVPDTIDEVARITERMCKEHDQNNRPDPAGHGGRGVHQAPATGQ